MSAALIFFENSFFLIMPESGISVGYRPQPFMSSQLAKSWKRAIVECVGISTSKESATEMHSPSSRKASRPPSPSPINCSTMNASAASFARRGTKVNWAASGCNQARSATAQKTAKVIGHDRPHRWTSYTNSPTSQQARCRYATRFSRYPGRTLLTLTRARMRAASSLIWQWAEVVNRAPGENAHIILSWNF